MTGLKKSFFHHFQLRLSVTKCLETNRTEKFVWAAPDIRQVELAQKYPDLASARRSTVF